MLRPERLTLKAREAVQGALEQARSRGNPVVNDAHLLSALLAQDEGIVQPLLAKAGVSIHRLSNRVESEIASFPTQRGANDVTPTLDRTLSKVFERAETIAKELGDAYVSTEHLLLALASEKGTSTRPMLEGEGLSAKELTAALDQVRGSHRVTDETPEQQYQSLERFTRNLTDSARAGKLDPVIGRDEEIRRVMQVLSRRTKNNPVLIGEPGVGKTAIVEGLAQRIVKRRRAGGAEGEEAHGAGHRRAACGGEVPRRVRGAAEGGAEGDRGRRALILFIDELHTLVGAGRRKAPLDAGNLLKPTLARGELHVHRCDDARRISQAHREGPGPRASVPADLCRAAASRTRSRSCGA